MAQVRPAGIKLSKMSTRIKQLMPNPWVFPYPDREMYSKEQMEHFAELLVKECINIVIDQKKCVEDQEVFNPRDELWNRARIQQSQSIIDKINQHFGIKR